MEVTHTPTKEEKFLDSICDSYKNIVSSALPDEVLNRFSDLKFPTSKTEFYKYTRTGQISNKEWRFGSDEQIPFPSGLPDAKYRMVFNNGFFDEERSLLPQGDGITIKVLTPSEVLKQIDAEDIFSALNQSFPQEGYSIHIGKNKVLEDALQVVFLYSGDLTFAQPRSVIDVENNGQVTIEEFHFHETESRVFANVSNHFNVADGGHLKLDIIQNGSEAGFHFHEIFCNQFGNSTYAQNTFTLRGNWTRNNSWVYLKGENGESHVNGFYIPNGKEHVDNHTIIDHEVAHCESNELYRGVLLDKSTGVFNGKVFVRQDAQKTNAFQSNGNIIVHDTATMNSKPELEIYADDVKCSHGSTTGQLDESAMFYLMARGLSRDSARKMLIGAFAEDVLAELNNEHLRGIIEDTIHQKLD